MVNKKHLTILKKGVDIWNQWRQENPLITPDLIGVDLRGADLSTANLFRANLSKANLKGACLSKVNLTFASLREACLHSADLSEADLCGSNLIDANLIGVNLYGADLSDANLLEANLRKSNLRKANLSKARMIRVQLAGAILTDCRIFGISTWGLIGLEKAKQSNLVITPDDEPVITVDNLEVAQFIYLLLYSTKIRSVIDTITSKVVLILGRFTPKQKAVLDAIRAELRRRNYLPVLFDFEKPASRDMTETVSTLAHMARFVIVDLTADSNAPNDSSVPHELASLIPNLPSVPFQPILLSSNRKYVMFEHFKNCSWVLKPYYYKDIDDLLKSLGEKVISSAEEKVKELRSDAPK